MFLMIITGDLVVQIPMPVLVGIMIMVCIGTFDWSSFSYLKKAPKTDAFVMLVTVVIVVATHDLSKGVIAGVIVSALCFAAQISKVHVSKHQEKEETIFKVNGQLFFAATHSFVEAFDFTLENTKIVIDCSGAHVWDHSAVDAIDKVVLKYKEKKNEVTLKGLNPSSKGLVDKLAIHDKPGAQLASH